MSIVQYTSNLTIAVGGIYDTSKYMLGNTLPNNTQELIPLLTDSEIKLLKTTVINIGFKVYDINLKILYTWSGSNWVETNDAVANSLSINTSLGQYVVNISGVAPTTGQVLTALSPYLAAWENSVAGVPPVAGESGLFLTNNGSSIFWGSPFPDQAPYSIGGYYLYTNGTTVSWELTPQWLANPMSAPGDLIVGGSSGSAGKLSAGAVGQSLTVVSSGVLGWTTLVPAITVSTTNKFLTNDGTVASWSYINQVPSITSGVSGYILSNNGTISQWIINTNPPSVSGQAGNFLTNNGTSMVWSAISQVPVVNSSKTGYFLTNDGSSYFWASGLNNPMTALGDIIVGGTSGTPIKFTIGTVGQFLSAISSTTLGWVNGLSNPMNSIGDIIIGGTAGNPTRLEAGSIGQVLTITSSYPNTIAWTTLNVLTNPMTSVGDTIIGGISGVPSRLALGASGSVLTSLSGTISWATLIPPMSSGTNGEFLTNNGSATVWGTIPNQLPSQTGYNGYYLTTDGTMASWAAIPAGFTNPMTTVGDMISANSGGTPARLSIGSSGQVLTVVSGGPSWSNIPSQIPAQTGYSGDFLTTNGTIISWSAISQVPNVTGSSGLFLGNNGVNYSWMSLPNQLPALTGQSGKYLTTDGSSTYWTPILSLPAINGTTSGQVLSNNGTNTYWESISSGASLGIVPISFTSGTLAVGGYEIDTVSTTCYTFMLQTIAVNTPCRVRFYSTHAFAVADYSRLSTTSPTGNVGLFAEFVFSSTVLSWVVSTTVLCFNDDTTQTTNIYITIQNMSTVSSTITLTMNILKMQ